MSELDLTEDEVRSEHLQAVNVPAQWAYMIAVIGGGLVAMLLLIAILGSGSG